MVRAAEEARERVAVELTGQKLPDWPAPVPITVQTGQGRAGPTTFGFSRGQFPSMQMTVSGDGRQDRLPASSRTKRSTPSWRTCSGGRCPAGRTRGWRSVPNPQEERARHDKMCREILNDGKRRIPLARLMSLGEYPNDVMALYAEGY